MTHSVVLQGIPDSVKMAESKGVAFASQVERREAMPKRLLPVPRLFFQNDRL